MENKVLFVEKLELLKSSILKTLKNNSFDNSVLSKYEKVIQSLDKGIDITNKQIAVIENLQINFGNHILQPIIESFTIREEPINPIEFADKIPDTRINEAFLDYKINLNIESLNPFDLDRNITIEIDDDKDQVILPFQGDCNLSLIFTWVYTETFITRKTVNNRFKQINKAIYIANFSCRVENDVINILPQENELIYTQEQIPIYKVLGVSSNSTNNFMYLDFDYGRNPTNNPNWITKASNSGDYINYSFAKKIQIQILPYLKKKKIHQDNLQSLKKELLKIITN